MSPRAQSWHDLLKRQSLFDIDITAISISAMKAFNAAYYASWSGNIVKPY